MEQNKGRINSKLHFQERGNSGLALAWNIPTRSLWKVASFCYFRPKWPLMGYSVIASASMFSVYCNYANYMLGMWNPRWWGTARHRLSPNTVSRAKNLCAFRSCQYWCSQKPKGMREIKKYSSPIQPRSGNSRWQKRQDVRKRSQHKLAVPTPASCLFPFLLPSGIPAGSERGFSCSLPPVPCSQPLAQALPGGVCSGGCSNGSVC